MNHPQNVRVSVSQMGTNKTLYYHSETVVSQVSMGGHDIAMATRWPGPFRGKATPTTLGPPALHIKVAVTLDMCGNSGSIFYYKNCIPETHRITLSLKKKYLWVKKSHFPN